MSFINQIFMATFVTVALLFGSVKSKASSTSHVSISLGKSSVSYNNDHLPGLPGHNYGSQHIYHDLEDSAYAFPHLNHFSPSGPFYHSTPIPPVSPYHQTPFHHNDLANPGIYGVSTLGPFYQSTPNPLFYPTTPYGSYFSLSTPKHARIHKVRLSDKIKMIKNLEVTEEAEKDMKISADKENKMNVEEKMEEPVSEMKKETAADSSLDKEPIKAELAMKSDKEGKVVKDVEMAVSKDHDSKMYHPMIKSVHKFMDQGEPLYIPRRTFAPHPVRPIVPLHTRKHLSRPNYGAHGPDLKQSKHAKGNVKSDDAKVPKCADDSMKSYCDKDDYYPTYEIENAVQKHAGKFFELYADIAGLNTELSVDLSKKGEGGESYLCPSDITYTQLFRAKNVDGKWRIIVNNIELDYQKITQTVRLEECIMKGESCPLIPHCYESKCLQKNVYHKFLVYNPYDTHFPFAIEAFKLPASCACHISKYELSDH